MVYVLLIKQVYSRIYLTKMLSLSSQLDAEDNKGINRLLKIIVEYSKYFFYERWSRACTTCRCRHL